MHRILEQVCAIAERERAEWLPEVTPQQLEQDGVIKREGRVIQLMEEPSISREKRK